MINIIKKEIDVEESLRKRLEIICDFCNTTPNIINGSIKKANKTNLFYIKPHKIIINNNVFLAFNYSNEIYINNLSKKNKINKLKNILKLNCKTKFHYLICKSKFHIRIINGRIYFCKSELNLYLLLF